MRILPVKTDGIMGPPTNTDRFLTEARIDDIVVDRPESIADPD